MSEYCLTFRPHNLLTLHTGIVSALADERHSAEVYEETFKYVLGTLLKVEEKQLAQHIAHYKQTKLVRDKAWAIKAVQSKVHMQVELDSSA